jgi:hypothetical protein
MAVQPATLKRHSLHNCVPPYTRKVVQTTCDQEIACPNSSVKGANDCGGALVYWSTAWSAPSCTSDLFRLKVSG